MRKEMHEGAVVALLKFLQAEGYTSTDLMNAGGDLAVELFVELMISVSNSTAVKAAAEAMMAKDIKA